MADALQRLGHEVHAFAWHRYLRDGLPDRSGLRFAWRKAQNKYLAGPLIRRINADLGRLVERVRPDLLFVYRGTHVLASTLRRIRAAMPGTLLVGYNNDDPFAPGQPSWLWRPSNEEGCPSRLCSLTL